MNPTGSVRRTDETASPRIRIVRAGFRDLVLVCTKCAKRQGLKKGAVRRMLKHALRRRPGPDKVRVVEVGCLGPCPKRALAVATSAGPSARRIHLLDPAASPEAAVAALFPDFGPKGDLGPVPITTSGNAPFLPRANVLIE